MDVSAEALQTLSQCFLQTLSPDAGPRRSAESYLSTAADSPGYALALLRLLSDPSVPDPVRVASAVHFKNLLRSRWSPSDDHPPISAAERDQIKSLLVRLLLDASSSSSLVQSQLSESLSLIGRHDFPSNWPSLLPELVASLHSSNNYPAINGILGAANSIFKKFRSVDTNDVRRDLKYCLDGFAAPLLDVFLRTSRLISSAGPASPPEAVKPLFESQRLCCRIFYSLNFIDLPEYFEDHMKEWMTEFRAYLTTTYPWPTIGPVVDDLRAAVCENLGLYMEKYEEDFRDYLKDFASSVWELLRSASPPDQLAVTAIRFLTKVSTSVHHSLFSSPDVLGPICTGIVVPNVRMREEDEEMFESNYVEYVRRDVEGSDVDTRRRIACELLKGIAGNYRDQVKAIVSAQIEGMLTAYAANPAVNWREMDCAIYLVVALAHKKGGGVVASSDLVDVEGFFLRVVVPELQSQDANVVPVLKADALKFFIVFRSQIPKHVALSLLPDVVRLLALENNVVHSYAASCIEKLLLVKDEGGALRFTPADVAPLLPTLIPALYNALKFPDSQENQYVMKCIMRVLGFADVGVDIAGSCITGLTLVLDEVCKNPRNPVFNHYLFEAVAALIRRSCERDPAFVAVFEASLFPVLQMILTTDVREFWPYTFQIFAQLVEVHAPPLPPSYMHLFELLLLEETWKRPEVVPALVRLLRAYLRKSPHELNQEGRLDRVIDIFNRLITSSKTESLGFYIMNTLIENLGWDMISSKAGKIWTLIFVRLQSHQARGFVKSLIIFMSLFLVKHGPAALVDSINSVQANVFSGILTQFWIPNLESITGFIEWKLTAVASTRLICESPALLDGSMTVIWGKMLDSIVKLLARPEEDRVEDEPEVPDIGENVGYTATFVRLYNAGKKEEDPLREIKDPREYLVKSLMTLSVRSPGHYPKIIQNSLDQQNQEALLQICTAYNCTIV
ncbi:Exportin-2 [Acorus gramineus]|uniref:Exportin-2 n=1 Tax=Acorus gramineus TaxID=55184 RepID=A0AAV9B7B4_ACOGR|nr:Exportin-2 [Acorus gramineus]